MRATLVLLLLLAGCAERPSPPTFAPELDEFLQETGLAVAVTQGREIVYLRALGVANLETREPLDPENLFLSKGDIPRSIESLRFNTELFPEATDTHDSLREAYAEAGERERAIASYERALALDPQNPSASEALERLR